MNVAEIFGSNVFSESVMKERLPKKVFDEVMYVMKNGGQISMTSADVVAIAMKDWAVEKGAVAFDLGAPVYYDAANGVAAASGAYAGRAVKAAESGDDVVLVRLEPAGDAGYANAG